MTAFVWKNWKNVLKEIQNRKKNIDQELRNGKSTFFFIALFAYFIITFC